MSAADKLKNRRNCAFYGTSSSVATAFPVWASCPHRSKNIEEIKEIEKMRKEKKKKKTATTSMYLKKMTLKCGKSLSKGKV